MATVLNEKDTRANPIANPDILGEDVADVVWKAVGLGAAALVNDKFVAPLAKNVVANASGAVAKAIDAATTALSAWGVGEVVGFVDRGIAKDMRQGGMILAGGKGLSILVPGFSLSVSYPNLLPSSASSAPKQLAAGPTNGSAVLRAQGIGLMGI